MTDLRITYWPDDLRITYWLDDLRTWLDDLRTWLDDLRNFSRAHNPIIIFIKKIFFVKYDNDEHDREIRLYSI